jgi:P-type Ca2+ transporter type 2C
MQIGLLAAGIGSIYPLKQLGTGVQLILLTLFNAVMNLRQEGQAAASIAALQKMTTIKAKARRDPPGYRASRLPNRHRPEPPPSARPSGA